MNLTKIKETNQRRFPASGGIASGCWRASVTFFPRFVDCSEKSRRQCARRWQLGFGTRFAVMRGFIFGFRDETPRSLRRSVEVEKADPSLRILGEKRHGGWMDSVVADSWKIIIVRHFGLNDDRDGEGGSGKMVDRRCSSWSITPETSS